MPVKEKSCYIYGGKGLFGNYYFFFVYIKKSNKAVVVPDSIDIAFINGGIGYTQSLLIHLKKIRITKKILNIVNVEYVV